MPNSKWTGKHLLQNSVSPTPGTRKSVSTVLCTVDKVICRQRKFKEALKKDGHQYAAGKVTPLSDTKSPKCTPAPSKRKIKGAAAAAQGSGNPSKKQKTNCDEDEDNDEEEQI